jgi:CheY-like chemotaxis protein
VAHDLNNLLTVISGYSEMVLTKLPPDDPRKRMVDQVVRAGTRAASLTRQLLAFSRQQVLEPKVLDLNVIVGDIDEMLRRLIGEDVQFTTVLAPGLGLVKVDPGQIEQVITNLAVNARDAMPLGGQLTIETAEVELAEPYTRTHADARPGRFAMLAVSDTGCGMAPEVKARIFEPFFTTKGVGRGTGLGLAVVHGIVKQSGGNIDVYSEVGKGTSVKVYLPLAPAPMAASPDGASEVASAGCETILLVEDEDSVRELATLVLEECGYTVLTANDGEAAVRIVDTCQKKIDILVTDVVMPVMGGRRLAEILRARLPELRVLFMSGYTDDAVVRHGVLQAEVDFLQKPFTPQSLAHKVRAVLDRRPDAAPALGIASRA